MSTQSATAVDGIAGWTVELMERWGGLGAGIAIAAENLFPPVPSEVILPMAGFAARLGDLSLAEAIAGATAGSLVGAWLLYALGAWLGHDRMRALILRIPLVDAEDVDKTTAWFGKHGAKAVLFGRMIPLFRSFISIPAGAERMNFALFTVLTLLGSLVWNSALIGAGYLLGANWHAIDPYTAVLQYLVIGGVLLWLARFVMTRRARRSQP
ncbi:DedA family protein [Mycolicibacterium obuense]|uniref:DedA family protein n=2 Tax=Mycolicibacterium obuense TaxID=1807 RepID=A0A4R5XBW5_9MYCO|nr:DedA family protein [Mycolicibacterium obuense]